MILRFLLCLGFSEKGRAKRRFSGKFPDSGKIDKQPSPIYNTVE